MSEANFVEGIFVKDRHPNTPEFILMSLSIDRKKLGNWLRSRDEEWINADIKQAKSGKIYLAINDFVPDASKSQSSNSGQQSNEYKRTDGEQFEEPPL